MGSRNSIFGLVDNSKSESACGTSLSTPIVTAAEIDFVDWCKRERGNEIDDPGILYTNLLLMGDRSRGEASDYLDSGYDNLVGF